MHYDTHSGIRHGQLKPNLIKCFPQNCVPPVETHTLSISFLWHFPFSLHSEVLGEGEFEDRQLFRSLPKSLTGQRQCSVALPHRNNRRRKEVESRNTYLALK